MKHTIDATDQKVGRLATKIATILMGKHSADFAKNEVSKDVVHVINVSKVSLSAKKKEQEGHVRYSGYPGGLRFEPLKHTIAKKGMEEVLREAVYGMLPANRLRVKRMKNLVISE